VLELLGGEIEPHVGEDIDVVHGRRLDVHHSDREGGGRL
jgi:hypothetical protein